MRWTVIWGVLVCAWLGSASSAHAEDRGVAFEIGARTGFALPLGTVANNAVTGASENMGDLFVGEVPFWLDAGVRVPHFFAGIFGQFGLLLLSNNATTGCGQAGVSSCSGNDASFGAQIQYHLLPDGPFDGWAGIGFGYEWVNVTETVQGNDQNGSFNGWQFFLVQVGADYKVASDLALGPFAAMSLGQYSSASASAGSMHVSGDITNQALHEWLMFGLRVEFDIAAPQ